MYARNYVSAGGFDGKIEVETAAEPDHFHVYLGSSSATVYVDREALEALRSAIDDALVEGDGGKREDAKRLRVVGENWITPSDIFTDDPERFEVYSLQWLSSCASILAASTALATHQEDGDAGPYLILDRATAWHGIYQNAEAAQPAEDEHSRKAGS